MQQQKNIDIFTRSPEKYQESMKAFHQASLNNLRDLKKQVQRDFLVIAAPISSEDIQSLVDLSQYQMIFDLRGESAHDPIPSRKSVPLKNLFADIESNRNEARVVKNRVMFEIKKSAQQVSLLEKQRPFGWEDLWSYA